MRECRAKYFNGKVYVWTEGWFHLWAPKFEEYETGPGNYMVALVEERGGQIRCCEIDSVKFTDTTEPQIDMASEDREKPVNSQGQRAIDTIDAIASRIKQGFSDYEKVVCIQMLLESYYEKKGNVIVDDNGDVVLTTITNEIK